MKRFNLFFAFMAIIAFSFTSCEKENTTNIDSPSEDVLNSDDLSKVLTIAQGFKTDYAEFKDGAEFLEFSKAYSNLNTMDRRRAINSYSFKTRSQVFDDLNETIGGFDTEEEVIDFVDQNSDILVLVDNEDGSKEVVEADASKHVAYHFLNSNGIIKVGEDFHKYVGLYLLKSKNYSELISVNNVEEAAKLGLESAKVVNLLNTKRDDLDVEFSRQIDNDNSFCKNDRRIRLEYEMAENVFTVGGTLNIQLNRILKVLARRRGIPCAWYAYSTPITWNDCEFTGDVTLAGVTDNLVFTAANETTTSTSIDRSGLAWGTVPLGSTSVTFNWTVRETRTTHQGMAGIWIEL